MINPYKIVFEVFHTSLGGHWARSYTCEYDDLFGLCDDVYKSFGGFRVNLMLVGPNGCGKNDESILFVKTIAEVCKVA